MASVTITVPNSNWSANATAAYWGAPNGSRISLGSDLSASGSEVFLGEMRLWGSGSPNPSLHGRVEIALTASQTEAFGTRQDFSDQMESSGTITFMASDGSTLVLNGIGDSSEPYAWVPSNSAEVSAFAVTLAGLSDRSLTITFNDGANQPPVISNLAANPQSVANGGMVALSADVTDPNMDAITYAWSASPDVGTFADATAKDTTWTAHDPRFRENVMLTLTASDPTESNTASISVAVQGMPQPPGVSDYRVLVDFNNDGSYPLDIYHAVSALSFRAGASTSSRDGVGTIGAVAGKLIVRLNNSDNNYSIADLRNKPIRVNRAGLFLWGGTIDDVQDKALRGTRRELEITAFGDLTAIGGTVQADLSESGDIPASQAVEELLGITGLTRSEQQVSDWSVSAGKDILEELRAIQNSSGTRVYEDNEGDIQLAGQGIAELWDITLADDQFQAGDRRSRRFKQDQPKSGIINAVVIDGTKYTDSDSVDAYGEVLHPSAFEFAVASEADTLAADIFSLYAEPADLYRISFLLEQLAGQDRAAQNDFLSLLHYGNERILKVRHEGEITVAEIIQVAHTIGRGERHIIDLIVRQRSATGIQLTLNTYRDREVGYFVELPAQSADGARAITGHKIQFRQTGTQAWTDAASSETGLTVNDTFIVPTADVEYDVRAIATSATGDEQTTPTQTFKAIWGSPAYSESTLPNQTTFNGLPTRTGFRTIKSRQIRLTNAKLDQSESDPRILGYDVQVRYATFPEGWDARWYVTHQWQGLPLSLASNQTSTHALVSEFFSVGNHPLRRIVMAVGTAEIETNPEMRYRPVFREGAIDHWSENADAERGLWTPWLDVLTDITVTY